MSSKESNKNFNFEASLEELNQLVKKMESGDLPLEDSLKCFENGVKLIRDCQKALTKAEQKVQILTKQQGSETLEPHHPDEN